MKLYLNETSPYARLVRVLLLETGLDSETELVLVDPWASPDELLGVNPAAKIPALVLPDGTCLIESGCIAEFLIVASARADLCPVNGSPDRARRMEVLGLGRAAMDCAFGSVIQQRFADGSPLIGRWRAAVPRLAERLEGILTAAPPHALLDLADLTVAVSFAYVDFRLPEVEWRQRAPTLAERVVWLGDRFSFQETRPT